MKRIRTAVIGCGNISTMHLTPISVMENAELVGVCDVKADRAEKAAEKYGVKAYSDYKVMIAELKPDVVHICTPHYLHPVITRFALLNGVNVLCEKPMAIKLEDAEENVKMAKEKNLKYGVVLQCRFNDSSVMVKKVLDSGELGKIISARSTLTWNKPDSYYSLSDWKGTWDKEGGGVVIDQAIHSIDLVNWFIGSNPVKIDAHLANYGHDIMEVDDSAEGLILYENGAKYGFWAMNNYGRDEPIEIRLCCEKGRVVMDYDSAHISFENGKELSCRQGDDGLVYEGGKDYWGFRHSKEIADFYDAVINDRQPQISGEEALKIQRIVCEIYNTVKNRNLRNL